MSCLHFEHRQDLHDNLSPANPRGSLDYGLVELSTDELRRLMRKDRGKRVSRTKNKPAPSPKRVKKAKKKQPVYRYRGHEVTHVWMKSEARPQLVRQLNPELRIVMGLWSHAGLLTKQKVILSNCSDSGEFLELNRKLLNDYEFTSLDAVRHCMAHGLPASAAVALHGEIVCTQCGNRTWTLPCLRCWRGLDDDAGLEDDASGESGPLLECSPTRAEPGSPDKIEVLRSRVSMNQNLWHPDDPIVQHSMGMAFCSGE